MYLDVITARQDELTALFLSLVLIVEEQNYAKGNRKFLAVGCSGFITTIFGEAQTYSMYVLRRAAVDR